MNNAFLKQLSKTGNLDANLILQPSKLDLMSRSMELQSISPKLRQDHIAEELGCSSSSLKRYRQNINKLSSIETHQVVTKENKKLPHTSLDDNSHCKHDPKRPQKISNDLKTLQPTSPAFEFDTAEHTKNENKLRRGGKRENIDEYLNKFIIKGLAQMRV